jgi:hypothetical protein
MDERSNRHGFDVRDSARLIDVQRERHIMKSILKPLLLGLLVTAAGNAAADRITLYTSDNFAGREVSIDRPISNLGPSGLNDSVNSAVVHEGRWEICLDLDFRGCSILLPGAYPRLGAYANHISSVRPVDGRYSDGRYPDYPGRNREARATLYEGPNMTGRAFPIQDGVMNLGRTGFNDRASSLRVESGYWIFCSDSEFRGECRTYGPGEYPILLGLNNVISSGRRISDFYPYADRPDWRDNYRPSQGALNRR